MSKKYEDLSDVVLANNVQRDNCNDSMAEIMRRHSAICSKVIHNYIHAAVRKGPSSQELEDSKYFVMYRAVQSYSPDKNATLGTWIVCKTLSACKNAIKRSHRVDFVSDEALFNFASPEKNSKFFFDRLDLIEKALYQMPDSRERQAIFMRYFSHTQKPVPYKTIARKFGVKTQAVALWDAAMIKKIKDKIRFLALLKTQ